MGPIRRNVVLIASALAGLLGSLAIVTTAPVWYLAPAGTWRLTIPGVPHGQTYTEGAVSFSPWLAGTIFVIGVIVMTLAWIGLIGRAERQRGPERRRLIMVCAVVALWAAPLLLAPPLLSNDAYSYAAQGELASRGIDPSAHGPVYLLDGKFMIGADPVWRNSPAPYGPVWIGLSKAVVEATGHNAGDAVWGFRGLAVIGVVMAAAGIALIARSYKVSPAAAVALGIGNPLVLLHLVGGSHNDALDARLPRARVGRVPPRQEGLDGGARGVGGCGQAARGHRAGLHRLGLGRPWRFLEASPGVDRSRARWSRRHHRRLESGDRRRTRMARRAPGHQHRHVDVLAHDQARLRRFRGAPPQRYRSQRELGGRSLPPGRLGPRRLRSRSTCSCGPNDTASCAASVSPWSA